MFMLYGDRPVLAIVQVPSGKFLSVSSNADSPMNGRVCSVRSMCISIDKY